MIGGYQGLGTSIPGNVLVGTAGSVAGATGAALTPIIFGAAAGPIGIAVGAVVSGVATLLGALGVGGGCGNSCVQATNIVNQAEQVLQQNLAAYKAGQIDKATALSNFVQVWNSVQQACSVIPGAAGQNCIGDRKDGACHYKDSSGACWNWFTGYYYPIANDTTMTSQDMTGGSMIGSAIGSLFNNPTLLLAGVGLIIAMEVL